MIIKKLRLQRGWSQDQLAKASGLSIRTIQRIEKGKTPGLESLKSLAAVFNLEISDLQQENTMQDSSKTDSTHDTTHNTSHDKTKHSSDSGSWNFNLSSEDEEMGSVEKNYRENTFSVSREEEQAFEYVRKLKCLYKNIITYILVISGLTMMNYFTSPGYYWVIWPAAGWAIGICIQWLELSGITDLFSANWEREQIEKRLGRKL